MEELTVFMQTYGWQLALIALIGIVILGVLKYANVFSGIDNRKPVYFCISVGISAIGAGVYLIITGAFNVSYLVTVTVAIYGLNQTMYAVYETTTLRDLLKKVFEFLKNKKKKANDE